MNPLLEPHKDKFLPKELEQLAKLDEFQIPFVVSALNGVKRVIASAGAGKSTTLIARALFMIRVYGVRPTEISLIAFNNKAAAELREKWAKLQEAAYTEGLRTQMQSEAKDIEIDFGSVPNSLGSINVSTLHGLGFSANYRVSHLRQEKQSIMSESQSIKLFKAIARDVLKDSARTMKVNELVAGYYYIEDLVAKNLMPLIMHDPRIKNAAPIHQINNFTVHEISKTGKLVSDFNKMKLAAEHELSSFKTWNSVIGQANARAAMEQIIERLYQEKHESHVMSFSDMILNTVYHLSRNEDILREMRKFTRHVLVDESQDLDCLQAAMVMTAYQDSLTLVGDPRQTLYTFRFSENKILTGLNQIVSSFRPQEVFEDYDLRSNYRSPKAVVDLSNIFASTFTSFDSTDAVPKCSAVPRSISIKQFNNTKEEFAAVAEKVRELKSAGVAYNDILVLSRSNRTLSQLEPHMISKAIPYKLRLDRNSPINQSAFKFLYLAYSIINNPSDKIATVSVFENVRGFGAKYLDKLEDSLKDFHKMDDAYERVEYLKRVINQISNRTQKDKALKVAVSLIQTLYEISERVLRNGQSLIIINDIVRRVLDSNFNFSKSKLQKAQESEAFDGKILEEEIDENLPTLDLDKESMGRAFEFTTSIYESFKEANRVDVEKVLKDLGCNPNDGPSNPFDDNPETQLEGIADRVRKSRIEYDMEPEEMIFAKVYSSLQTVYEGDEPEDEDAPQTRTSKKQVNRVMLSTIHSAKGAEADYVIWCGLAPTSPIGMNEWEAEKCCHYVALTRPKIQISISSSIMVEDFSGKLKRAAENPFLGELVEGVQELIQRNAR